MHYDIRLVIDYDYAASAERARTLLRLLPGDWPGQSVIEAAQVIDPPPDEEAQGTDFFGNRVTTAVWHRPIPHLRLSVTMRVSRGAEAAPETDTTPPMAALPARLAALADLGPASPLHFVGASPRVAPWPPITAFARAVTLGAPTARAAVLALSRALHGAMTFDAKATSVDTTPAQAFAQRRGVCQDFAQVMIAGLRGIGIPAGYVSGFLRTTPPPGRPRLEGVDAMHAWVRAWVGTGWIEIDPTNDRLAGEDYITVAMGRDYADVAPVSGAIRSAGGQGTRQAVDVVPLTEG